MVLILLGVSFLANKLSRYPTVGDYKKTFFDLSKKEGSVPLYTEKTIEILETNNENLVGVKCTPNFGRIYPEEPFMYSINGEKLENKNPKISNLISRLEKMNPESTLIAVRACLTDDGRTFIDYTTYPGKRLQVDFTSHLAQEKDNKIENLVKIIKDRAYTGCGGPLQLTKDNIFYRECSGGDGPRFRIEVYKIDLNNRQVATVQICHFETDVTPYKRTCE